MVIFGHPNNCFDHIWKAAATAPALGECMVDLRGNDELPRVLVEERHDGLLDFLLGDQVAVTDEHRRLPLPRRAPGRIGRRCGGEPAARAVGACAARSGLFGYSHTFLQSGGFKAQPSKAYLINTVAKAAVNEMVSETVRINGRRAVRQPRQPTLKRYSVSCR